MTTGPGRGMTSGPGGERPRFPALAWALPLGVFLLFAATGRIDLTDAFSGDQAGFERWLAQQAVVDATAQARQAAEQPVFVAEATPTTVAARTCEPSGDERFCLYTVQEGDSLASIAARFDLDGGDLPGWELLFASNQPDLGALDDFLQPDWVLRVPHSIGVLHLVLPGDSVSRLAEDYGVTTDAISTTNALSDPDSVQIGDILFIPEPTNLPQPELPSEPDPASDGDEPEDEAAPDEEASEEEGPEADPNDSEDGEAEDVEPAGEETGDAEDAEDGPAGPEDGEPEDREDPDDETTDAEEDADADHAGADGDSEEAEQPGAQSDDDPDTRSEQQADDATHMSWPVVAVKITNYMTARHPLGVDFGLAAHQGSPIAAAAGGTVSFAGGNACCSYGLYVIVDHGDGLQTLYAHLSSLSVEKGETVARGDTLGIAGATGNSRGVHLHFEVYKDGKRVDPMNYLPN